MNDDICKWKIKDLKPHPRYAELFPDLKEPYFLDLTQHIHFYGLQEPLEILPDGTIVSGHQRVRAAQRLGWGEIDVRVNHDLAAQGAAAVEQRLIEINLSQRQLDKLQRARCYSRLLELAPDLPERNWRSHRMGRLRDVIARNLFMSARTLERYIRVLDAPPEVQEAFRNGRVSLVNASKAALLPKEVKEELAADIRAGEDVKKALSASLANHVPAPLDVLLRSCICNLERTVDALEGQASRLGSLSTFDRRILERGWKLIGEILLHGSTFPLSAP